MKNIVMARKLKRNFSDFNILSGDSILINNNRSKPVVVWVEKRDWSVFGKIINFLRGKKK